MCIHLDHGEVGQLVLAHQLRIQHTPVTQRHPHVHRSIDDVVVRYDVAIGRDNHAAADPMLDLRLLWPLHLAAERTIRSEELRESWRHTLGRALLALLLLTLLLLAADLTLRRPTRGHLNID